MSKTRPFLIGKGAGGGVARALLGAGAAAKSSASPQALSPAEQAVVAVDFRNSRRDGFDIHTSIQRSKASEDRRPDSVQRRTVFRCCNLSAICSGQSSGPTSRGTSVFLPR